MTFMDFIESINEHQSGLIGYLDKQFLDQEGVTRKMRFRIPFYDFNKWICYLNPVKDNRVELCFLDGIPMKEMFLALDTRGRKKVSGLMLDVSEDIPIDMILEMIAAAKGLAKKS